MIKVIGVYRSSFVSDDGVIPYYQVVYCQEYDNGGARVLISKCIKEFFDCHSDCYDRFYYDKKGRVIGGVAIEV